MQDLSDNELVRRWRSVENKREAEDYLNELFGRYRSRVAVWCYRFTGDREAAGDLAQEVFLKVFRHLDSFEGSSKFSTWLYTVARNHCFNEAKARSARPEQALDALEAEPVDAGRQDALASLISNESRKQAGKLMAEVLDETERTIMALHFGNGLELGSITRLLGLTNASGARAYIQSAKRKLSVAVGRMRNAGQI